eukprot:10162976-Alexandrium_andersonii.AAC.1
MGPPSPMTQRFLDENPAVDGDGVNYLRDADRAIRHAVIVEGPLLGAENASSALVERAHRQRTLQGAGTG